MKMEKKLFMIFLFLFLSPIPIFAYNSRTWADFAVKYKIENKGPSSKDLLYIKQHIYGKRKIS